VGANRPAAVERHSRETTFPVVVALEALDAWFREPTPPRRVWLGEALAAIVRAAGALGAWLEVNADPLQPFTVGFGTLSRRPPSPGRPGLTTHRLVAADGSTLGSLWLDTPAPEGDLAARALELAIDAAWARASVRRTADRLEALDVATRAIAGVLDVELVLQLIVDRVRDLVGARYAALGTVTDRGTIERFITSGITAEERAAIGPPPQGHGLLGLIIREGRSIRTPDISAHPESHGFPANHPPMRSLLGVPVTVKGVTIGNLYLTDKQGAEEFGAADQRTVEMFALHAGIAIETARLHDKVQRLAVVEERERIGKDLHDGIIQSLYAIALSLEDVPEVIGDHPDEALARVDRAIDGLNLTIRDIRNFILGLHSELAGGADLVAGLATLAHEFRLNSMIEVELNLAAGEAAASTMSVEDRGQILQIAREALSNAARHSHGSRARIELQADEGWLTLRVEDNGVGFDPEADHGSGHLGLGNLRARAASLGGALTIYSRPGDATGIILRVPADDGLRRSGQPAGHPPADRHPPDRGGSVQP
jgi:signal transduction histidine kinase